MCNRYTYTKDEAKFRLREKVVVFGRLPKSDIRITDIGFVIVPEQDEVACLEMRWGWRVPWDTKPLNNAKSETITTLTTFKSHLQNRCLIPADGFYEKGVRFIQPGEPVFCFAGLWRAEADGQTYTMLTTTPNETVAPFHNRMPFILRPEQYDEWLGEKWEQALANPDRARLEKIQKQPELF